MVDFPRGVPVTGGLYGIDASAADRALEWTGGLGLASQALRSNAARGWTHVVLSSPKPLLRELEQADTYHYHFLSMRSGSHLLLVSTHGSLVEHLLREKGLLNRLKRPDVAIEELVWHLMDESDEYAMRTAYARVYGYGASLRSLALYGEDLAEAELFRELMVRLAPYSVRLARGTSGADVMSIGAVGEVSFVFGSEAALPQVVEALNYLSTNGFIAWPTEPENADSDG